MTNKPKTKDTRRKAHSGVNNNQPNKTKQKICPKITQENAFNERKVESL